MYNTHLQYCIYACDISVNQSYGDFVIATYVDKIFITRVTKSRMCFYSDSLCRHEIEFWNLENFTCA